MELPPAACRRGQGGALPRGEEEQEAGEAAGVAATQSLVDVGSSLGSNIHSLGDLEGCLSEL